MPVLSEEAFLFLHDWVCNSEQHHPAKGEGLKFSIAFLLQAWAPGTLSLHPAGACLNLRALPFCLDRHGTWEAPAERKLSCCWQLKLGAQLSLQSCPWLRKGSWSHICCCWPTIPPPCMVSTSLGPPVPIHPAKCQTWPLLLLRVHAIPGRGAGGSFGQGLGWEPPPSGSRELFCWLTPSQETLPQDSCKRRKSTNSNLERSKSSFFHLRKAWLFFCGT